MPNIIDYICLENRGGTYDENFFDEIRKNHTFSLYIGTHGNVLHRFADLRGTRETRTEG